MMKAVFLKVLTWVGTTNPNYERKPEHYYGTLIRKSTNTTVEVKYVLSEADVRKLREEDFKYKAGDTSGRFFDRNYLIEQAKQLFVQRFPDCEILFEGDPTTLDPQPVLIGPDDFVKRANDLVAKAEANDWWEGDEKKMKKICNEWEKLCQDYGVDR
jgi:hypothetical protein